MKKISLFCLGLFLTLLSQHAAAQLALSVTPTANCLYAATTVFSVTTAPGGVTSYSWGVSVPAGGSVSPSYSHTTTTGSNSSFYYTACGVYTTYCWALSGTSVVATTTAINTILCSPTISVNNATICAGSSATLTASGASSYTFYPNGGAPVVSSSIVVSPTASACYTVLGTNGGGCTGGQVGCVIVTGGAVTISSSGNTCAGGTVALTASGGSNYTWTPGNITATSIVVSPTTATCYTVIGITSCGSGTASAVQCVSISSTPVTITGASATCGGANTVLHASGATSYVWSNGATTANINVAPGCYTVVGTSGTCSSSAVHCFTATPAPTITVAGSTTICAGSTTTLTASGASSYTWNVGVAGPMVAVSPTANTCYLTIGVNAQGCTGSATTCVVVNPAPALSISGPSVVCFGSSYTLTASGGTSYNWNTGSTSSSIVETPSTPGIHFYSVASTGTNGCTGVATRNVLVDSLCAIVWPGDANSDGVVDNTDVLEIGLIYGVTGAARTPGGNAYTGQYATTWTGYGSTGKNRCHVDCNGDGTVDNGDTVAIFNNYLLTHAFKNANSSFSNPDISIVAPAATAVAGDWNIFDIVLGSSSSTQSQLYGVAFDVQFDNSLVESNSAYITYPSSFINAANQNVQFRKTDFTGGKIYAATVRTNGSNVSGNGTIAQLHLKLKSTTGTLNLNVLNTQKVSANGSKATLNANPFSIPVEALSVGLNALSLTADAIQLFPNPAKGQVMLQSSVSHEVAYSVTDLSGREITKGTFVTSKAINLDAFESGIYIIKAGTGANTVFKKLVVEK